MTGIKRLALILFCVGFAAILFFAYSDDSGRTLRTVDFAEIYFGGRAALQHSDPYDPATVLRQFLAEGGKFPPEVSGNPTSHSGVAQTVISNSVNLPTAFFLFLPFALLRWSVASYLWVGLSALLLAVAAWFTWDIGASRAPPIWAWFAGLMLIKCQQIFTSGNIAGFAVALCIIGAWCFLKERYALAGVVLLAISLAIKPHDSGFIWLYFLLAGGTLRKRALQTFAVAAVIGLCTVAWISRVSPHWYPELHRNLNVEVVRGGIDDPGPTGPCQNTPAPIIDLQAAISVFKDDPAVYNRVSYLLVGVLVLVWGVTVLRRRSSLAGAAYALATVSALTLLPVYHRPYDAMILLLALPACAILWAARERKRWIALALTLAAILVTTGLPLAVGTALGLNPSVPANTLAGKLAAVLILRPAPLTLLALGCFYLWVYIRCQPPASDPERHDHPVISTSTLPLAC
ncbi:MAG TPA: glycosyltransferase 87 family protein [Terracidiphilus sp.]|nr:glycosyltransferase 87 family protein [Terracidiphilus sp.]